jgi:hypothetical protein
MATRKKSKKKRNKANKAAPKKKTTKKKPPARKAVRSRRAAARLHTRSKAEVMASIDFEPKGLGARSGGQSGDLQGLSNRGRADSESVDELLEEGNAFEAEAVKGVEDAGDREEGEVRTHEVPEDDVPDEYDDENEQA